MSVQVVGQGTNHLQDLNAAEQVQGLGGRLAALLLASELEQQQAQQEQQQLARESFRTALAEEVKSLHEAADEVFWGAVVQGSVSLVSGGLTVGGALSRPDAESCKKTVVEMTGDALGQLAAPLGKLISGSDGQHSQADARAHAGEGQQASWERSDARDALERSRASVNKTVEWLDGMASRDAAASSAVLANLV